jgi:hypothetical protein
MKVFCGRFEVGLGWQHTFESRANDSAEEMAERVKSSVQNHPLTVHKFGRVFKMRRWWLDIDFPYGPPPEFEQSGYVILNYKLAGERERERERERGGGEYVFTNSLLGY